jgi:DNA repair exonuclease SbcCD ATPase subunit
MAASQDLERGATFSVRNVGGIDATTVELAPGVNVLAGRNATNRTSFLQAIMAALGSDDVSIKGDADEAEVELELGAKTYRCTLTRQDGTVRAEGDPYLEDPELADLFAFLLESNEARRAVASGRNLRDLIMRPVDLEEIKADISRLEGDKRELDEEIETIDARKRDLPDLEAERAQKEDELEETRAELEETEAEIEAADADVETEQEDQNELEEKLEELSETRTQLEDVRYELETERESIRSLQEEQSTLERELEALSETPRGELADLESSIDQLRERRRRLDGEINSLQSTIRFNEEMLEGERTDVYEAMDDGGNLTDDLLEDGQVACWTCGTDVDRDQITATIDQLKDIRTEKLETKRDLSDELDDLKADKRSLERQRERRQEYEAQLERVDEELEQRRDRIEDLQDRRESYEATVEELEAAIEELESDRYSDILELHREANQLEYELGRLENDLQGVESEIEAIEDRLDDREALTDERADIEDELETMRTRVETVEAEAVEAFNEHMAEVLGALDYDNLDRVWIERVQREVREGRRKGIKTFFELHVVRSTESGTTYEDTVDHLSESEREVTGLVFALAGYLVHEVYEEVPFMLLDSLEAIDSERIAKLVEYFGSFADYLVVALLEEDARALSDVSNRIESI